MIPPGELAWMYQQQMYQQQMAEEEEQLLRTNLLLLLGDPGDGMVLGEIKHG
jgi:hypothetical protein